MSSGRKEVLEELYRSMLTTIGVVALSMVTQKVFKEKLVNTSSVNDVAKLGIAVSGSTMVVDWAIRRGFIPKDI